MQNEVREKTRDRNNERGAALVMALMLSFLLLAAVSGLLLEAAMNTANVTDSTAEQQAYNAAESGVQSVVNVLRGNVIVTDDNRIDPSKPATDKANKIDFVKAITPQYSNLTTSGFDAGPRLSRWLRYETGSYADRIKLESPGTAYTAANGYAYSLNIFDPDHTGSIVSFWTKGLVSNCDWVDPSNVNSNCEGYPYYPNSDPACTPVVTTTFPNTCQPYFPHRTYGSVAAGNFIRVTYLPRVISNQDVSVNGDPNVDFGSIRVEKQGTGGQINGYNRFEIVLNMTTPYRSQRVIRGWIETNTLSGGQWSIPRILFDSQTYTLQGSLISLTGVTQITASPNGISTQFYAKNLTAIPAGSLYSDTPITGTMTPPEPMRLVIQSTGYGPRGAEKRLEAIIQKNFFNGLTAPATLTLVGAACPAGQTCFAPGSSNVTTYSGDDAVSTDIIPPIGTTNGDNLDDVQASVDRQPPHPFNGNIVGVPSNVSNEIPDWLSSPAQTDIAIHSLANTAMGSADPVNSTGRFFPSGTNPTTFGNNTTGTGITFCDGNCTFTGAGGGILVVTGTLTLHGNFNFRGLIIVTGAGGIERSGGGTGILEGNIVVVPYANSRIGDNLDPAPNAQYLPPRYDLSGGGNSTIQYNSSSVANGLTAVSNFVVGVAEK
jgi:hypothetical protein